MSEPYAIEVRDISKTYRLYRKPIHRLMERWTGKVMHRPVHALKSVSLDVEPGRCIGLLGANGAGKSTLLKILTGTTLPTTGSYTIRGEVQSLLELGTGFSKPFTGRQNIIANLCINGCSPKEAAERVPEIVEFSDLGKFIDAPVRTYSSGMTARLGFSVAISMDPEVLILDEILAVGDMAFQRKCHEKIWDFKSRGKTMFFCSHSLYHIRQLCDEAIWLRNGEVALFDDSVTVTNEYATFQGDHKDDHEKAMAGEGPGDAPEPKFEEHPRILDAVLFDPRTGKQRNEIATGDPVGVRVRIRNGTPAEKLTVLVGFARSEGGLCFAPSTEQDGVQVEFQEGTVSLILKSMQLLSGEFEVPVWLMDERGLHRLHQFPVKESLVIRSRTKELGFVRHDHEWRVEAVDQALPSDSSPKAR